MLHACINEKLLLLLLLLSFSSVIIY